MALALCALYADTWR